MQLPKPRSLVSGPEALGYGVLYSVFIPLLFASNLIEILPAELFDVEAGAYIGAVITYLMYVFFVGTGGYYSSYTYEDARDVNLVFVGAVAMFLGGITCFYVAGITSGFVGKLCYISTPIALWLGSKCQRKYADHNF